jgi:hypothetical protein
MIHKAADAGYKKDDNSTAAKRNVQRETHAVDDVAGVVLLVCSLHRHLTCEIVSEDEAMVNHVRSMVRFLLNKTDCAKSYHNTESGNKTRAGRRVGRKKRTASFILIRGQTHFT